MYRITTESYQSLSFYAFLAIGLLAMDPKLSDGQTLRGQATPRRVVKNPDTASSASARLLALALEQNDSTHIRAHIHTLSESGQQKTAANILLEAIRSTKVRTRLAGVTHIQYVGVEGVIALPELIAIIAKDQSVVKRQAIVAIGVFGNLGQPALPALLNELKSTTCMRESVLRVLGEIGQASPAVTSTLREWTRSPQAEIAIEASVALIKVAGDSDDSAVKCIQSGLLSTDENRRKTATLACIRLGSLAQRFSILCTEGLESEKDLHCRELLIRALGAIGPGATGSITALTQSLRDESALIVNLSALALARIGPPALASLIAGLQDPEVRVRRACAVALRLLGKSAKGAIPALRRVLDDVDSIVREQSATTIREINN